VERLEHEADAAAQRGELVGGDGDFCQRTKSGVDAVDRLRTRGVRVHHRTGRVDAQCGLGRQSDRDTVEGHTVQVVKSEGVTVEENHESEIEGIILLA